MSRPCTLMKIIWVVMLYFKPTKRSRIKNTASKLHIADWDATLHVEETALIKSLVSGLVKHLNLCIYCRVLVIQKILVKWASRMQSYYSHYLENNQVGSYFLYS